MKLLINATCVGPDKRTGIERFSIRMARELHLIDSTVEIVGSGNIDHLPVVKPRILAAGRTILGRHEYLLRAVWDQTAFRSYIHRSRPSVVFFPIQDGLLFPSVKQIVTVHDLHYLHFRAAVPECRSEIPLFRQRLYRIRMPHLLMRWSSAVVAVSESTKQELIAAFGIAPEKIHVIYNGYDEDRFRLIDNPHAVLQRYGLTAGQYFLFVGSILRHKNIVRLVQSFARIDGGLRLVIAGACKDTEYLNEITKAAACCGVSSRIRYLEYVSDEDLPFLYNGACACLLPSLHEGFGIPLVEAMACGTPVITSDRSAMREVVGNAALLVDPDSIDSIAAAIRDIQHNPQQAEALRQAGFKNITKFKWSNSAKKLYDLCMQVSGT